MATIGSMCSGVGGLDLGVAAYFDANVAWVSDNDPDASEVLTRRFPNARNLGDLRSANCELRDAVDIITCGFPCGPVAPIGRQKGITDPRWLCPDIVDFLDRLPQPPSIVVFENVVGLLSNEDGSTVRAFLGQVAELGFTLRWGVVQAADAQAPHRRSRWVCVATHTERGHLQRWRDVGELARPAAPQRRARLAALLATPLDGTAPTDRGHNFDFGKFEPVISRWEVTTGRMSPPPLVDGHLNPAFPEWMMGLPPGWVTDVVDGKRNALRLVGNAVVPHQALLALDHLTQG